MILDMHELHDPCISHTFYFKVVPMAKQQIVRVSAAEFQRNIGRYQDLALSRPVAVSRNGREGTVLISEEEYRRLKRRDREVLGLDDFTDDDLKAIENAEAPLATAAFDHEVK